MAADSFGLFTKVLVVNELFPPCVFVYLPQILSRVSQKVPRRTIMSKEKLYINIIHVQYLNCDKSFVCVGHCTHKDREICGI